MKSAGQNVFGVLYIIVHVLFRDDLLGIPAAGVSHTQDPAFFAVIFLYFFGFKMQFCHNTHLL